MRHKEENVYESGDLPETIAYAEYNGYIVGQFERSRDFGGAFLKLRPCGDDLPEARIVSYEEDGKITYAMHSVKE